MSLDLLEARAAPVTRRPAGAPRAVPASAPVVPWADTIFLRGIRVEALIGVYEHERHTPRPLVVDLEFGQLIPRKSVPKVARP